MRKSITGFGLATVLTLGTGTAAIAQSDETAQEVETDDNDDSDKTGLFGLLGLLGLAGLAGLKRRDRTDYGRGTGASSATR